jgi:hypothetical protein
MTDNPDDDDLFEKICNAIGFDDLIKLMQAEYQRGVADARAEILTKVGDMLREEPSKLLEPPRKAPPHAAVAPPARPELKPASVAPKPAGAPSTAPAAQERPNMGGRPSKGRPEGIPSNSDLAVEAISAAGTPLTGPGILAFVREKYWPSAPPAWTSALFYAAKTGVIEKLPHERYGLPKAAGAVPSVSVAEKKAPNAAKPPAPIAAASNGERHFEHKGREIKLLNKEWRVVSALGVIIDSGFLDYSRLMGHAFKNERQPGIPARDFLIGMVSVLNPKLVSIGLQMKEIPKMGFCLRELS